MARCYRARMRAPRTILTTLVALGLSACGRAPEWLGSHRMTLSSPGGELPFRLTLSLDDEDLSAVVGNGSEQIEVPAVVLGDALVLKFPHYDSELQLDPVTLDGEWIKRRGRERETRMRAKRSGDGPRFPLASGPDDTTWTGGRYAVDFSSSADAAVGLFRVTPGDAKWNCEGTFLTTLGDYRYLAGNTDGTDVRLSCFDGAHAFLFRARLDERGELHGDFWSRDTWHETWTAHRDRGASLRDPFALTKWTGQVSWVHLAYPDLDGRPRKLNEPSFQAPARILVAFGTWCPRKRD